MKLFWKLYCCLFGAIALSGMGQLFDKNSLPEVYYQTTIIFSNWFILPYFLYILNTFITCIAGLLLAGYAFDLRLFSRLPSWFLYVRFLSDCAGHSYEFKTILSFFAQGKLTGVIAISALVLPVLPSYIVQWRKTGTH